MTLANKITLTRIAMAPIYVVLVSQRSAALQIAGLVLFCIASFTDFLDGYIARKYNQVTDFGKFADPLADKLLTTAAFLNLIAIGFFPAWMVFLVLAREFIITSLRIVAAGKGIAMAAAWSGKVKTCVQIGGIILLSLLDILQLSGVAIANLNTIALVIATVILLVTLYSGIEYMAKNKALLQDR